MVWPNIDDNLVLPSGPCVYEVVLSCTYCERTVVEFHVYGEGHDYGPHGDVTPDDVVMVWPTRAPRELDVSVPEVVRSLYSEASIAEFAGASRGAAALYRAAVEELCRAEGVTGKT
jgi:hypothetical protein